MRQAADTAWPCNDFAAALRDPSREQPSSVTGPSGKAAVKRFNVYRNNVAYSLGEALAANFPAVRALCGAERFAHAARLHVAEEPPVSPLLFKYGHGFAGFLDRFPPARQQMPWLADVARLERAWLDAYHAADRDPLAGEAMAAVPPEQLESLRLVPHPAFALVRSSFAVFDLFQAGRSEKPENADPEGAQDVLVTRPALEVLMTRLQPGQLALFEALATGGSLGEAVAAAFEETDDFDFPAAMTVLLSSGAFSAIRPGN